MNALYTMESLYFSLSLHLNAKCLTGGMYIPCQFLFEWSIVITQRKDRFE